MEGFMLTLDPTGVLWGSKGWGIDRLYMALGGLYERMEAIALEEVNTTQGAITLLHRDYQGELETKEVSEDPEGPEGVLSQGDEVLHALALFEWPENPLKIYCFSYDFLVVWDGESEQVVKLL